MLDMDRGHEMRDEVVLQSADDVRVRVPIFHTDTACPGAVTAYLLRRIAYRAGSYAPGIQEMLFHDLTTSRGATIERVQAWMGGRIALFHSLGYRIHFRWAAEPTEPLANWVREGRGHRGAVMTTTYEVMHPLDKRKLSPQAKDQIHHAVGLAIDRLPDSAEDELVMVDPWPGANQPDRVPLRPDLDDARRLRKFNALKFFWVGWS